MGSVETRRRLALASAALASFLFAAAFSRPAPRAAQQVTCDCHEKIMFLPGNGEQPPCVTSWGITYMEVLAGRCGSETCGASRQCVIDLEMTADGDTGEYCEVEFCVEGHDVTPGGWCGSADVNHLSPPVVIYVPDHHSWCFEPVWPQPIGPDPTMLCFNAGGGSLGCYRIDCGPCIDTGSEPL